MRKNGFRCAVSAVFTAVLLACVSLTAQTQLSAEGQQQFADLGVCNLANGQQITGCRIGYRTWGKLNTAGSNAVLFPTWFTGTSGQLAGEVSAAGLVDPAKYFVIVVDALGNGVSSSPSNSTTQPGPLFPAFTTQDMVNAEYRVATETLHLKHLHAVMGISMGGMQTFEWMVNYPNFMEEAIPIVGSTRLTGRDLLLWYAEEDALKSDPAWDGGHYRTRPIEPMVQILHQMNLTTPANYAQEHPRAKFAADYAEYFKTGILPFDANDWLAQLEAMIHHDVAHGGSMDAAAHRVKARVLIVVAAQDHMVNHQPALDFAAKIGAKTLVLQSDCGHQSPGCEAATLNPAVRAFLNGR